MQIDRVIYPIKTLGPGNRIGIWTIGCPHKCFNCSNPELWKTDETKDIPVSDLIVGITEYSKKATGVTITGGDPFFQPTELMELLLNLRKIGVDDILVYTGYEYNNLKKIYPQILKLIDVLIDGRYIDKLNDNKGIRGSSNQNLIILNNNLREKYEKLADIPRQRQNFIFKDKILSIGIPNKID